MAMRLFAEDREILAKALPIHGGVGNLMHPIICSAHGNALLYSKTIGISLAVRKGGTRCPQRVGKYPRLCRLTSICAIPRTLYCVFGEADPPLSACPFTAISILR